jgi:hypothetical protein
VVFSVIADLISFCPKIRFLFLCSAIRFLRFLFCSNSFSVAADLFFTFKVLKEIRINLNSLRCSLWLKSLNFQNIIHK